MNADVSAGKFCPDGTLDERLRIPTLSVVVGSVHDIDTAMVPFGTSRTMSSGQFDTTGGVVSATDTG